MTKIQINTVVEESVKLFKDNPDWSYKKIIKAARRLMLKE